MQDDEPFYPEDELVLGLKGAIETLLELSRTCEYLREVAVKHGAALSDIENDYASPLDDRFRLHGDVSIAVRQLSDIYFYYLRTMLSAPALDTPITFDEFIEKYLDPRKAIDEEDATSLIRTYFEKRAAVPEGVKEHIKKMNYADFLKTPYWTAVSLAAKARHPRCQLCGSDKSLEVHHPTYDIRGEEISRLDELTVLCHVCHSRFHAKDKK